MLGQGQVYTRWKCVEAYSPYSAYATTTLGNQINIPETICLPLFFLILPPDENASDP